jgi:hypothetical protein
MQAYTESSADTLVGSVNGANTDFTVTNTPYTYSVLGFVNGTFVSTTVSGKVVTFSTAPESGDTVTVHYSSGTQEVTTGSISASDIIDIAMKRINRLGSGQTISSSDQTFALAELNNLIDHWRALRRFVVYYKHAEYTFTASKQYYTIGWSGADFEADRPIKIIRANLIRTADTPDSRVPLLVYEMTDYAQITYPATSGSEPMLIYYQPTTPNGTIYPYPYPNSDAASLANKLELFTWSYLDQFASTSTTVEFAPGYKDAIIWTLSERLADSFGTSLTPVQTNLARQSRSAIASNNMKGFKITRDNGIPMAEAY